MTARELLLLCWISYIDLPLLYISLIEKGGRIPLRALADYALRRDLNGELECVSLNSAAREAARELQKSTVDITGYINKNDGDGFAAYIFDKDGMKIIAMRGSERAGLCVGSNIDWADNVCEPFAGSVQLETISSLVSNYPAREIIFTGHSKGGHNALLALAVSENPDARAYAFNGQGFGADALDDMQLTRLRDRGINYVVADDVVGALLMHPEKRIYVRRNPGTNAHMPEAFMFDAAGMPVTARRTLKSQLLEAASRIADNRIDGTARRSVRDICRAALGR